MFKQLLKKLDRQIDLDKEWDFCDGHGTCVRWPIAGGKIVKFYKLNDSLINSIPYKNKDVEDLF